MTTTLASCLCIVRVNRARRDRFLAALTLVIAWAPVTRAQAPAEKPAYERVNDLNARYKFIERYSSSASLRPGENGQYRVATRETVKIGIDLPEGDKGRSVTQLQTIYTERPYEVSSVGTVTATVRLYERAKLERVPPTEGAAPRPVDGLLIWYKTRTGRPPTIISLSGDRTLQVSDFNLATRGIFLPNLSGVMPVLPSRIGDTWRVSAAAIEAIAQRGERIAATESLAAKLMEIRRDPQSGLFTAVVGIAGRLSGNTTISAEALFSFEPAPASATGAAAKPRADGGVEARGAVTNFRLTAVTVVPVGDDPQNRKRRTDRRELVLQRQTRTGTTPLALPPEPPAPTMANSWLTHTDPAGRFHVRYPQDFRATPPKTGGDELHLVRMGSNGPDVITIDVPATPDPKNTAEVWRDAFYNDWEKKGLEVLRGPAEWLPEVEWPGLKVYRVEAAMKPAAGAGAPVGASRLHFDGYLIKLDGDRVAYAEAYTGEDPPLDFRKMVEDLLKTFKLGVEPPSAP
ncbi:hypothetical protein EP7_000234 [Isosphaeraceae bacterium EP7]